MMDKFGTGRRVDCGGIGGYVPRHFEWQDMLKEMCQL